MQPAKSMPNPCLSTMPKYCIPLRMAKLPQCILGPGGLVDMHLCVCWAICRLAKSTHNPPSKHFQAVKRAFQYLASTVDLCLFLSADALTMTLHGYCNSDWGGPHSEELNSTTGYVFMLTGGSIPWASQHQNSVSLTPTEAEYVTAAVALR